MAKKASGAAEKKATADQEAPKAAPPPAKVESSFGDAGERVKLAHFDTEESRATCEAILDQGRYDWPAGVKPPKSILDVGAYVGASTLSLARQFPDAVLHAFEPCAPSRALLKDNVAACKNVTVHERAVWDRDGKRRLFDGRDDPATASLVASAINRTSGEEVETRQASLLLDDLGILRVDCLKVSTAGGEVAVLEAIIRHLEGTSVIFVEYRSEADRRRIDLMLCAKHMLVGGVIEGPNHGHLCYVLRRSLDREAAGEREAVKLHRTPDKKG